MGAGWRRLWQTADGTLKIGLALRAWEASAYGLIRTSLLLAIKCPESCAGDHPLTSTGPVATLHSRFYRKLGLDASHNAGPGTGQEDTSTPSGKRQLSSGASFIRTRGNLPTSNNGNVIVMSSGQMRLARKRRKRQCDPCASACSLLSTERRPPRFSLPAVRAVQLISHVLQRRFCCPSRPIAFHI